MHGPTHLFRRLAALRVLGAALAVLLLVSPRHGVALSAGDDGLAMVICGAGGSYTLRLPAGGEPEPAPPPLCCLAAASVALPSAPPQPAEPRLVLAGAPLPPARDIAPATRRALAHPPRAPPAL